MLPEFWFVLVAVLWTGFLVLEGFDFGVAALMPALTGRRHAAPTAGGPPGDPAAAVEADRRALLGTIGPVWDGNEVWLLTAGGAMFAAFPGWYASLFSGFYLALFLVLVALIIRGVALEYRGKVATAAGRAWCDRGIVLGGILPPLLFGVAFANIVRGVEMTPDGEVTSTLFDLLNPYGLLGGVTLLLLCLLHGAVFTTLKTDGALRVRARAATGALLAPTAAALVAFAAWTLSLRSGAELAALLWVLLAAAVLALAGAAAAWRADRDGWAFTATAATIAAVVAAVFAAIFPEVLPALGGDDGLTIDEAASSDYTLTVMTVVALVMTPIVITYQAWSYWVFRQRVRGADAPASSPVARAAGAAGRVGAAAVADAARAFGAGAGGSGGTGAASDGPVSDGPVSDASVSSTPVPDGSASSSSASGGGAAQPGTQGPDGAARGGNDRP